MAYLSALEADGAALSRATQGVERIIAGDRRCFSLEWRFASAEDWHLDPYSGYRWPVMPADAIDANRVEDDSDIQSVWETSRLEHVWRVAIAARSRDDETLARWAIGELRSWIAANPIGTGVNWIVTMECALRAVAAAEVRAALWDSPAWDRDAESDVVSMLKAHALWTLERLPEWGSRTQNHLIASLVGLLALSAHLPEWEHLRSEVGRISTRLGQAGAEQVLPDGFDFENAIGYHLLVAELLGYAVLCANAADIPIAPVVSERLERMVDVAEAIRWSDGRRVQLGDDDDDFLAPSACGYFEPGRAESSDVLLPAYSALGRSPSSAFGAAGFRDAGVYVLGNAVSGRMFVNAMRTGVNGSGPHRHADPLSFCLELGGVPVVVDRGTYRYQSRKGDRKRYRAIPAHASARCDGVEPLEHAGLFALEADPFDVFGVDHRRADAVQEVHASYRMPCAGGAHVLQRRAWTYDGSRGFVVEDNFSGDQGRSLEVFVPLAPGVEPCASAEGPALWAVALGSAALEIALENAVEPSLSEEISGHSDAYRVEVVASTLRVSWRSTGNSRIVMRFAAAGGAHDRA